MALRDAHEKEHEYIEKFDNERWRSHHREHSQIARALERYKEDSNEWRGSLSDLRATFITKETYDTKHEQVVSNIDAIEKRVAFFEDREKGAQGVLTGTRALIVTVASVTTTIIAFVYFILSIISGQ